MKYREDVGVLRMLLRKRNGGLVVSDRKGQAQNSNMNPRVHDRVVGTHPEKALRLKFWYKPKNVQISVSVCQSMKGRT